MALLSRFAAALALCLALLAPAAAQDLTDAQQQALVDRVTAFDLAMRTSDMAGVLGVIPPKVLDKLARAYIMTPETLIEVSQKQINEALKTIKIVSFSMDLTQVEGVTLADGLIYTLIPTETVMDLGPGGKHRSNTSTVALLDEGVWYLMAIDDAQQVGILRDVYPLLADVTFPTGTMEAVAP